MNDSILSTITGILDTLTVSYQNVSIEELGAHTLFSIQAEDSALLIGPKGEHLKSLNLLVKRMLEKRMEEVPNFLIDVNGYHKKRIERISQSAKMLAERAKTFKHDVEMEPMSAYDRMIVHAALSGDSTIKTESEGEGKFRHVVLKYAPDETRSPVS